MLLKSCTQMPTNLEITTEATELEKVSFHSNPEERQCQKNAQTASQLLSFNTLARLCSKSFKLGFNTMWTKNFQIHKLDLRKGRGTRYQIANIWWVLEKARGFQKSIYFCFIDYIKAFDCVDHNQLWNILTEMRIPDHFTRLLRNLYAGQEATVRTRQGTTD